ncbi:putative clathrin assembly protein At2g01600 [Aegilops tauschii subsp. strangulata]|uniref:ENTH domain-containing protein n=4 Tax=Triticinae TaxID=1648030 RepID=A0A452ZRJ0_AEGTS|nr:putative clathrin assembly protein At2g01600 [Aegilops tauschii subsp. strangulata]XP_044451494.1 putative clathrin assembly protein At2g01600 [Triticum aestivum]
MASMQSWRKAYGAIKDTTTVSLANINSDFKDLDVAIVKATNHVECPPKERHLRKIAAATSIARPRADIAYCIHALSRRLSKTRNWIVALKTLVVVHRLLREGDPTFREELLNFTQRGRILQLSNFKDDSSPIAWDCSAWVRTYGQFLEERLECFRILKYDVEAERLSKQGQGPEKGHSRTRDLDSQDLLEQLPALQQLLYRLVGCRPEGAANNNYLVQYALALVLKESFKIYCAINDGIINLVDKFFEMARHEALKALEIYRRAGQQAGNLSDFYENCRGLELARNFQFPTLREPPQTFLVTMEEYVRDAPRMVPVREPLEFPERLLLTYKPEESEEVPEPDPVEEERPPVEEPVPVQPIPEVVSPPTKPVVADTGDLLGLNDPSPGVSAIEESNALALAIVTSDASTSTTGSTAWQDKGFDPTGWELALVTAPSNTNSSATDSQLGGGLDKLILDSLYDEGAYRQSQQQQLYGSSAPNPFMTSDPFAMSNHVAAPSSVQMAAMSQQQQQIPTMIHQNPFGPPIQPQHPGAGPAAVNPFLDSGFGAFPAANNSQQQANPFGGSLL